MNVTADRFIELLSVVIKSASPVDGRLLLQALEDEFLDVVAELVDGDLL